MTKDNTFDYDQFGNVQLFVPYRLQADGQILENWRTVINVGNVDAIEEFLPEKQEEILNYWNSPEVTQLQAKLNQIKADKEIQRSLEEEQAIAEAIKKEKEFEDKVTAAVVKALSSMGK